MTKKANLSFREWAGLQNGRIARIYFHRASIEVTNKRFVMRGPSGEHSIDVNSTMDRVNAHWKVFANHVDNRIAKA